MEFFLDPVLKHMQVEAVTATLNFYGDLMLKYRIIFYAFLLLLGGLSVGFIVVGFAYLKRGISTSEQMLQIMPFESLDRNHLEAIKLFFSR